MPNVIDRQVVLLSPEKWNTVERLLLSEDVLCGDLALALRDNPVFDADTIARASVRVARRIARGEDPGRAGFEVFVDRYSAIGGEACPVRECDCWRYTNTEDDKFCIERLSVAIRCPMHHACFSLRTGEAVIDDQTLGQRCV